MELETRATPDPSQSCPRCHRVTSTSRMATLRKPITIGGRSVTFVCRDCWDDLQGARDGDE